MKLLFALDLVYSGESANIRLAKLLAGRLAENGFSVRFLVNALPEQKKCFAGQDASFFTCTADKVSYDAVKQAREAGKGAAGQALALAAKPAAAWNLASTILRKKSLAEGPWRRAIEQECAARPYDAVIAVSCPHYSMFALADAEITAKKICYMLDPYWSNASMPYAVSLKREEQLYRKIDAACITDLMYAENQNTPLAACRDKMHVMPFPGLAPEKAAAATIKQDEKYKTAGTIRLVYAGNLYPAARDPEPLLRLVEKLPNEIGLSLYGGGREGFPAGYWEAWQKRLGARLLLHDAISAAEVPGLLANGDILVNLGNRVANQLPSKVFEYLSTGMPVWNVYQLDNCPTLPYFARYPLAQNTKAGDFSTETLQSVENFCRTAKGRRMPYPEVERLFPENTAPAVAERFAAVLKKTAGEP